MKFEDIRKKYLKNSANTEASTKPNSSTSAFESIRKKYVLGGEVDQKYIDAFVSDANNFLGSANEIYKGLGEEVSTDWYETWRDLQSRASSIQDWLHTNKVNIDENEYNNLSSALNDFDKYGASMADVFKTVEAKNTVLNAEDFETYLKKGQEVENPDWYDTFAPIDIFGWTPFGEGENINNMVTFAEKNSSKAIADSAQTFRSGGKPSDKTELINLINQYMTEDEKNVYNYYIGKGETEKAEEYLAALTDTLNQRLAGKIHEQADENALELVFSAVAGLNQFGEGIKNIDNYIMGTEADATSAIQHAQQAMSSNNEGLWRVTNDLTNTIANQLPSILVGAVTGGVGGALTLSTSALGNAYAEMRNLGYNERQSRDYATLVAASEFGLSSLLSGISSLGGKLTGKSITKIVSGIDNAFLRVAASVPINMASEGLEEAIQTALEPVFEYWTTGEDFEAAEWSDIIYSGLLGALSAGMLETPITIANTASRSKSAKNAFGSSTATESLINQGLEFAEGTEARGLAEKYNAIVQGGNKLSGSQLAHLYEASESQYLTDDTAKLKNAILKKLGDLGETHDVTPIAEVLVKYAMGEKLTSKDYSVLNESDAGHKVLDGLNPENIKSGGLTDKWAESIGTRRVNPEAYNKDAYEIAKAVAGMREAAAKNSVAKTVAETEKAIEGKAKVSESGREKRLLPR